MEFMDVLVKRRSIYDIGSKLSISQKALEEMLGKIILNMPTAFNMQSTRMVLLAGAQHKRLWDNIVLSTLRQVTPPEHFPRTQEKIAGFSAGYGTVLFFDDDAVTKQFMRENELYSENFPPWALQQNGMLQYAVWVAFADKNIGASLQHYNPLIDNEVKQVWNLPSEWKLLAQMPFGSKTAPAGHKDSLPIEKRFKVFGA